MNGLERIRETGEWWITPWWEESGCNIQVPSSKEEIQAAAEILQRHFTAEWARDLLKNPRVNFILPLLCMEESTSALRFILSLGSACKALASSSGFLQKINDLKQEKAESAFFELETAHAFFEAGYHIVFPKEGGTKKPDILASSNAITVAVECKRLQDEVWENWETALMNQLSPVAFPQNGGQELTVQVSINPRLTDILVGNDESLNQAFKDAITQLFVQNVKAAIDNNSFPLTIEIGEFGKADIDYKKEGACSSITGVERGTPAIFRRILQNGFLRAHGQLPEDLPGVVVIYSKHIPNCHFFEVLFDALCRANPEKYGHILGVMLCPMQTILQRRAPVFFCNQSTHYRSTSDEVFLVLKKAFGAITANSLTSQLA